MKKILIVYATAGIGHKKASMAVKAALDEVAPKGTEVTIIDSLDYTNDFFKWTYLQAYLLMVNKLPTFWGMLYHFTDNRYVDIVVSKLRRINNWFNSKRFEKYLLQQQPDVIISTHFFASEVIGDMKSRTGLKSRLVTVVTDYRLHSWWVADNTDYYVVASQEARKDLLDWHVEESRIKVLGIPVEPVFSKRLDKQAVLSKCDLEKGMFTILVIGGGFGIGPIAGIVKSTGSVDGKVQVVAVCGHNDALARQIESLRSELPNVRLKVLGFVNNVYEYMDVSSVLISKSGGITVSESLAKELPMIVISPIIGQETRNCRFLISNGAAFEISSVAQLAPILNELKSRPEKLARMKEAISLIRKPMACYDVAKLALEI